jgi:DEAD/DEAH box helicase
VLYFVSANDHGLLVAWQPTKFGLTLLDLRHVSILVLDEADLTLDMGFLPSLRRIVGELPKRRQTLCFSATLQASVAGLVQEYTSDPVRIAASTLVTPAETLESRNSERVLAIRMLRCDINAEIAAERTSRPGNTLASRTLQALPGEVFV